MTLKEMHFENVKKKGENAGSKHFLLFLSYEQSP